MQLQQLVKSVLTEHGPELVAVRMAELHDEEADERCYLPLCALDTKVVPEALDPPMTVKVEWYTEEYENEDGKIHYIDVSGYDGRTWGDVAGENCTKGNEHELFRVGLEGCSWATWAGLEVDPLIVEIWEFGKASGLKPAVPPIDFVAACMWEMCVISNDEKRREMILQEYIREMEELVAAIDHGAADILPVAPARLAV